MVRECKYGPRVAGKCPKKPATKPAVSKKKSTTKASKPSSRQIALDNALNYTPFNKKASKPSSWQLALDNALNYSQAMLYFRNSREMVVRNMKEDGISVLFDPSVSRLMKPFIRILIDTLQTHPEELADFFDRDLTLTWMHHQIIKEAIDEILYTAATIARGPYKLKYALVQTKDVVKAFKRISFTTRVMEIAKRT